MRAKIQKEALETYLNDNEEIWNWEQDEVAKHAFRDGFDKAWDIQQKKISEARTERDKYARLASDWMMDCDKLKQKYEPRVLVAEEIE
jgi:hypothetical protein